jgi:S1-C subfamily serine protease
VSAPARADEDPLATMERQQQALFDRVAPAVVFISNGKGFGSGFFITSGGLVLTNAHVVEKQNVVDVVLQDGRKLKGTVIERAADDIDLALVQVPVTSVPTLVLGESGDFRVGTWVASVGHGMGGIWTFTTGMISNIYPLGAERPVFQTQIPLNPGNSGGPIFDRQGRVLGVVTSGIENTNAINFAIRADVALRKLSKLSASCDCLVITAPAGVPIFVNGKMVGTGPRVVVPATAQTYEVFAVIQGTMRQAKLTFPAQKTVDLSK